MNPNHTGLKVLLAVILTIAFIVIGVVVYLSFYPLGTALPDVGPDSLHMSAFCIADEMA